MPNRHTDGSVGCFTHIDGTCVTRFIHGTPTFGNCHARCVVNCTRHQRCSHGPHYDVCLWGIHSHPPSAGLSWVGHWPGCSPGIPHMERRLVAGADESSISPSMRDPLHEDGPLATARRTDRSLHPRGRHRNVSRKLRHECPQARYVAKLRVFAAPCRRRTAMSSALTKGPPSCVRTSTIRPCGGRGRRAPPRGTAARTSPGIL